MKRYQELMHAKQLVVGQSEDVWREERDSPAWHKLMRVKNYLQGQAEAVMNGFDEDGKEVAHA